NNAAQTRSPSGAFTQQSELSTSCMVYYAPSAALSQIHNGQIRNVARGELNLAHEQARKCLKGVALRPPPGSKRLTIVHMRACFSTDPSGALLCLIRT